MRQNEQDTSTRRFSTATFDCTPPRAAVEELLRPKRARMFRPPDSSPGTPSWFKAVEVIGNRLIFWGLGIAFMIALCSVASYVAEKRTTLEKTRAASPAPAPIVQPTPVPIPAPPPVQSVQPVPPAILPLIPPSPVRRAEAVTRPVRRATLVLPEVRRAELINIPLGTPVDVVMPDGTPLNVRYMGTVSNFGQLPRNPHLNDMYKVLESGNSWIWYTPAGFNAPAWVDP